MSARKKSTRASVSTPDSQPVLPTAAALVNEAKEIVAITTTEREIAS